ncbi:MAG: hypothetical protein AAF808_11195 [Cyanobacteria bacterium P01_D01_bin.2]
MVCCHLRSQTNAYPVVSELGDFKGDEVNVSAYGRNSPEVIKLADRVG